VLLEGRTPILIDFGLARVADDPKLTHTGWLLGTPGYLAPEILYGDDATTASDVHSWAATVAFAGTGHPPFGRGPSMAIMDRVRRGEHDLSGLPADLRSLVGAALDPDPARRPELTEIVGRLGRETVARPATRPEDDPFTLPLALAAEQVAGAPTEVSRRAPAYDEPYDQELDRFVEPTPTRHLPTHAPAPPRDSGHDDWDNHGLWDDDADDLPVDLEPVPPRDSAAVVLRRMLTLVALALAVGGLIASRPYWSLAVLLAVTWLLRTCTLTVTAHGDRRRLRGARWYDVLVAPLSAPWYLVAALPGALLLAVWALGVGLAGLLLCYAAGLSTATTLVATAICVEAGLWVGPGAGHVRWPVRVVAQAVARRTGRWAVLTVVLLAVAGFAGHQASLDVGWSPFGRPPLVGR
jgi:hypothetical protein